MAKFLVATIPVVGHVTPMLPIVKTLIGRGHEVWWYTGQLFKERIEAVGARFLQMKEGLDYSIVDNVPTELAEQRASLKGVTQLKFDLKYFFIEAAIGYTKDLLETLEIFSADLILADSFFIAASWVHEAGGPPWAQLGISVLTVPSRDVAPFGLGLQPMQSFLGQMRNRVLYLFLRNVVFRDTARYVNEARSEFGLESTSTILFDLISPYLYLAGTIPSFEYPRSDLPPQVHFIGVPKAETYGDFYPPTWWEDLPRSAPVVHVTQGTVATDPNSLIIPTLQALKDEDVLVVATTGNKSLADFGYFTVPDNARVESFIDYHHLLPHVDVMVTNGGYNGVQAALNWGIPLVAAGRSEDKPEVCARIAWCGAGIDLKTGAPQPARILKAVKEVLSDKRYRQRARELRVEIQTYRPTERAATLLEELIQAF